MPLPVGAWRITTDTLGEGTLTISSADASGNVTGSITIPSSRAVVGFFDAGAQTVNLSDVTEPTETFTVFSAALFQVTSGSSKTQTTTDSVLAGTYEVFPPHAAAASTGRWVASLNQKIKEKDKEEKEKEHSKDTKDQKDTKDHKEAKDKEHHLDQLPVAHAAAGDPASQLQQLALRVDAIEERLATGQPFIGTEERPEVGNQVLRDGTQE
jgi:hypothetical protein